MITNRGTNKRKYVSLSLLIAAIGATIAGSVLLVRNWQYVNRLAGQGYLGLFFSSLLAGSPIPIPTPSMILTFTLGSLLNPLLVGTVAAAGNTVGNSLTYFTGRRGINWLTDFGVSDPSSGIGRFLKRLRIPQVSDLASRRGVVAAIFLLSIFPNPALTPMVIGLGARRFQFSRFLLICWVGLMVQGIVLAYLGYFGLGSILRALGVFKLP